MSRLVPFVIVILAATATVVNGAPPPAVDKPPIQYGFHDEPHADTWRIAYEYICRIYPERNAGRIQPAAERATCLRACWAATNVIWSCPAAAALFSSRSEVYLLLLAQGGGESGCNPRAISADGWDLGWGQINSRVFRTPGGQITNMLEVLGVGDPFDVRLNAHGQAVFLRDLLVMFGDIRLAVGAYNAGPASVRGGELPQNGRTPGYVRDVMEMYGEMKKNLEGWF